MRVIGSINLSVNKGERSRRGQLGYVGNGKAVRLLCRDRGVWIECADGISDRRRQGETARDCAIRLAYAGYGPTGGVWDLEIKEVGS